MQNAIARQGQEASKACFGGRMHVLAGMHTLTWPQLAAQLGAVHYVGGAASAAAAGDEGQWMEGGAPGGWRESGGHRGLDI